MCFCCNCCKWSKLCPFRRCPFRPPRCYLGCLLTVRIISTAFTFLLFIFSILSRCVYYQFWKTYDVFFLLLHTAIAFCLVPLRKDDVFWRLHHLRVHYHERGLSIKRRKRAKRDGDDIQNESNPIDQVPIGGQSDPENPRPDDTDAITAQNTISNSGPNPTMYPTLPPPASDSETEDNAFITQPGTRTPAANQQPDGNAGAPAVDVLQPGRGTTVVEERGQGDGPREEGGNLLDRAKSGVQDLRDSELFDRAKSGVQDLRDGTCLDEVKGRVSGLKERMRQRLDSEDSEDEGCPEWQKKLASGLHLGVCLLRLRITLALVIGLLHRAVSDDTATSWKFMLLIKGLYIHIPLLWFQILFAIVRQLRLWGRLGCARFYLWLVALVAAGLVLVEIPFHALQENSDKSWCYVWVDTTDPPALCRVFACMGPNGTRTASISFSKTQIVGGATFDV